MAEKMEYMSLREAVDVLNGNGFDARLCVVCDTLSLFAVLTRQDFNDGQGLDIFFVGVHDGQVLRESLDGKLAAYKARMAAGEGASEVSAIFMLREAALRSNKVDA